MSSEASKG
jgi:hypothetical protein